MSDYYFDCQCEACTKNYGPDLPLLNLMTKDQCLELYKLSAEICTFGPETPLHCSVVREFGSELLAKHDHLFPCQDVFMIQECLILAINIYIFKKPTDLIFSE